MPLFSSQKGFNLESLQVLFSSATIALTGSGLTNLVNVSEIGELSSIGIFVAASPSGTPTITLEVQIDGLTTQTLALYSGTTAFAAAATPFVTQSNEGSAPGDTRSVLLIPIGTRYATSCRVGINVSAVAGAGSINVTVVRGKKN